MFTLRSVVTEIGCSDELADNYITVPDQLADRLDARDLPRLACGSPHELADRIAASSATTRALLVEHSIDSSFKYRVLRAPVMPVEVSVSLANSNEIDDVDVLCQGAEPHQGVALLIVGGTRHATGRLHIDADGVATLEPLGLAFSAATLPPSSASKIHDLLGDLSDTGDEWDDLDAPIQHDRSSDGPETSAPSATVGGPSVVHVRESEPLIELTTPAEPLDSALDIPEARMLVKVLGPPRIVNGPDLGRRQLNLVVFLACAGRPVGYEHIQDAIWRGNPISRKSVFNLIASTRTALGQWDGEPIIGPAMRPHGHITLHPDVRTDLDLVRELLEAANDATPGEAALLLDRARSFMEGPPFDAPGYDWAHDQQLAANADELICSVTALAQELEKIKDLTRRDFAVDDITDLV